MNEETTMLAVPNVQGAVDVMRQFQTLKRDLLSDEDMVTISGKKHIKRSGWRKIALAFNISTSIISLDHEQTDDGRYIVRVRARATTSNGRFSEEIGACDSSEFERGRLEGTLHNVETKAATRAINRAISDLVGGGEISAEEVGQPPEQSTGQTTPEASPEESGATEFRWTVNGTEAPMELQSGPYGFLRGKMIQGLIDKHGVSFSDDKVGETHVSAFYLGGLPLDDIKDVVGAIIWALTKLNNCAKADVKVLVNGKEWVG